MSTIYGSVVKRSAMHPCEGFMLSTHAAIGESVRYNAIFYLCS